MNVLVVYCSGREHIYRQITDYHWDMEHATLFLWSSLFKTHEKRIPLDKVHHIHVY